MRRLALVVVLLPAVGLADLSALQTAVKAKLAMSLEAGSIVQDDVIVACCQSAFWPCIDMPTNPSASKRAVGKAKQACKAVPFAGDNLNSICAWFDNVANW